MPSVQDYKLFVNSLDFEKIYKESLPSLQKNYSNIEEFYNKYTRLCINNKTIKLLYNESEIIGYILYSIKNRILRFHFYYISSNKKNRRYGRYFREEFYQQIKDKADKLETNIFKTNYAALNAARKTAKKLNLHFSTKEINSPLFICKQYSCEISKVTLHNGHKSCESGGV